MLTLRKEIELKKRSSVERLKTFVIVGSFGAGVLLHQPRHESLSEKCQNTSIIKSVRERYGTQLINDLVKQRNRIGLFSISSDANYPLEVRKNAGLASIKMTSPRYKQYPDPKVRDNRDYLLLKVAKGYDPRYDNFNKVEYPQEVLIAAGKRYLENSKMNELHILSVDSELHPEVRIAALKKL